MPDSIAAERELSVHELGFLDLDTPERQQVVSGVAFLSDPVNAITLWGRLQQFVNSNSQYRCRIVNPRSPVWRIDEKFDLSNHCAELTLNESSNEEILTYVSNVAARGLPVEMPVWRIAIIRTKGEMNQPERCAIAITFDVAIYTVLIFFADPSRGLLLIGYPAMIAASGLFYRTRFVVLITSLCLAGFLSLWLSVNDPCFVRIDFCFIFMAGLIALGMTLTAMIRRVRSLQDCFSEKRRL